MRCLRKFSQFLNRLLMIIGGTVLVIMVLLTCSNIFFRLVWVPVRGTFEMMGFFGAVVTAFALGHTQQGRGHIAVDILVNAAPAGLRKILCALGDVIACCFFILLAWQVGQKALVLMQSGEVTETLRIVYYPFTFAVSLGCLAMALVMVADLIGLWSGLEKDEA